MQNLHLQPWPPFKRAGTTITQRTTGDKLSSTGDIEIIDAKKLLLGTGNDGQIYSSSDDLYIENVTSDKDIIFRGNDGGVATDIAKFDVSAGQLSGMQKAVAGVMTNAADGTDYISSVVVDTTPQLGGTLDCQENNIDNVGDIIHDDATASDWTLQNIDEDKDIIFSGNDGGAQTNIMVLDVSAGQLSGIQKAVAGVMTNAVSGTDYLVTSSPRVANAQTGTTYEFVVGDEGKVVTFNNASAITVTVPVNADVAIPVGSQIDCIQIGAGKVTFVAEGGVTLNSKGGLLAVGAQHVGVTLWKQATNTWWLLGDLIA